MKAAREPKKKKKVKPRSMKLYEYAKLLQLKQESLSKSPVRYYYDFLQQIWLNITYS